MAGPFDFAAVQWARKMTALIQEKRIESLTPSQLHKLSYFLEVLARFRSEGGELTTAQAQVIFQTLYTKELVRLESQKDNVFVEFTGGEENVDYERFLIRPDGKVPNHKYEKKLGINPSDSDLT